MSKTNELKRKLAAIERDKKKLESIRDSLREKVSELEDILESIEEGVIEFDSGFDNFERGIAELSKYV